MNSLNASDSTRILIREMQDLSISEFETLWEELKAEGKHREAKRALWLRCATDKELFALVYFPHYCQLPFNELHSDVFANGEYGVRSLRRARAAPRGYAKSTLEALIEPIHDVCYGLESFIVIFSNTEDQSASKLRDIRTEVLTNDRLLADYRISFFRNRSAETKYVLVCGKHQCMFQGFGANTEVRGIRFGAERPSKIILDDAEHSDEVHNEAIRAKYENWMFQVVSKLGNEHTNIKIIGTILHPESLLAGLIKNPAYDGKIYKAVISWTERQDLWDDWQRIYTDLDNQNRFIDSQGFYFKNEKEMLRGTKVLWPEKEPYLYLMKELIETGRRAFFKEKQNEPIGGDEAIFDRIHYYRETEGGLLIESTNTLLKWKDLKDHNGQWFNMFGALDPAHGQTKAKPGKKLDYASMPMGIRDPRGRLLVHDVWMKRAAPSKQIAQIFEMHAHYGFQKFAVETNLFRELLSENLVAERKRIEEKTKKVCKIPFYDVEQVENKEKRIYTLEPKVTHGWILFNRALDPTFMRQIEAYPYVDHDDGPDSLEILWNLIHNRYKPMALSLQQQGG